MLNVKLNPTDDECALPIQASDVQYGAYTRLASPRRGSVEANMPATRFKTTIATIVGKKEEGREPFKKRRISQQSCPHQRV